MKTVLFLIATLACSAGLNAADILFSDYRETESFKRISEHFTGKENPGRYVIARTDPQQRDGYYVALKLSDADQPQKIAAVRIQYVKARSLDVESKTLELEAVTKPRLLIGLTDGSWAAAESVPTAWKIELLDAQGKTLSHVQSFLWDTPSA